MDFADALTADVQLWSQCVQSVGQDFSLCLSGAFTTDDARGGGRTTLRSAISSQSINDRSFCQAYNQLLFSWGRIDVLQAIIAGSVFVNDVPPLRAVAQRLFNAKSSLLEIVNRIFVSAQTETGVQQIRKDADAVGAEIGQAQVLLRVMATRQDFALDQCQNICTFLNSATFSKSFPYKTVIDEADEARVDFSRYYIQAEFSRILTGDSNAISRLKNKQVKLGNSGVRFPDPVSDKLYNPLQLLEFVEACGAYREHTARLRTQLEAG